MVLDWQCEKHICLFYLSCMLTYISLSRVCCMRVQRESTVVDLIRNISLVLSDLNPVTQIVEPAIPFSLILFISLSISLSVSLPLSHSLTLSPLTYKRTLFLMTAVW